MKIILIGFMGAGKTTVGQALARRMGAVFADTDRQIEERAGMSVSDIFAAYGEERFREMETEALQELLERGEDCVVSAGGGLPLRPENRELLGRLGTTVYLRVRPETVLSRLKGDATRPLLAGPDPEARVRGLLSEREPVYRAVAALAVDTDGLSPEALAEKIQQKIVENSNIIV